MSKVVALILSVFLAFMLLFAVMIATGRAETTQKQRDPLENFEIQVNPYTYLLALPIEGQILDDKYTNIRFWPYGAPELFDETVLFCGDVTPAFDGKHGPLIITYRIQGSKLYKGLACHELLSVFEVNTK